VQLLITQEKADLLLPKELSVKFAEAVVVPCRCPPSQQRRW